MAKKAPDWPETDNYQAAKCEEKGLSHDEFTI